NISKIKAFPYSFHLLEQLFYYKEKFLNEDLKNQLSFFDDDIKKSPLFKSFTEYFSTSSTYDKAFPSIKFENQDGNYKKVGSDSAGYNLIVYGGRWGAPVRKDVADLKELYNKFSNKGLAITSISIDWDKRNCETLY